MNLQEHSNADLSMHFNTRLKVCICVKNLILVSVLLCTPTKCSCPHFTLAISIFMFTGGQDYDMGCHDSLLCAYTKTDQRSMCIGTTVNSNSRKEQ